MNIRFPFAGARAETSAGNGTPTRAVAFRRMAIAFVASVATIVVIRLAMGA